MQIRYIGFDHKRNTRMFHFEIFREGTPIERCTVSADVSLFLQHGIAIQEGPALCAQKLGLAATNGADMYSLGCEDLCALVQDRKAASAAEKMGRKSRRSQTEYA